MQHIRLLFQKEKVDSTVEITAYTDMTAFNIGFAAKIASSIAEGHEREGGLAKQMVGLRRSPSAHTQQAHTAGTHIQ